MAQRRFGRLHSPDLWKPSAGFLLGNRLLSESFVTARLNSSLLRVAHASHVRF
jgi:hypothetical protein